MLAAAIDSLWLIVASVFIIMERNELTVSWPGDDCTRIYLIGEIGQNSEFEEKI